MTVTKTQAEILVLASQKESIFAGRYHIDENTVVFLQAGEDFGGNIHRPQKIVIAEISDKVKNVVVNGKLFPIDSVLKHEIVLPFGDYYAKDRLGKSYTVYSFWSNGILVSEDLGYGDSNTLLLSHGEYVLKYSIPELIVVNEEYVAD